MFSERWKEAGAHSRPPTRSSPGGWYDTGQTLPKTGTPTETGCQPGSPAQKKTIFCCWTRSRRLFDLEKCQIAEGKIALVFNADAHDLLPHALPLLLEGGFLRLRHGEGQRQGRERI